MEDPMCGYNIKWTTHAYVGTTLNGRPHVFCKILNGRPHVWVQY